LQRSGAVAGAARGADFYNVFIVMMVDQFAGAELTAGAGFSGTGVGGDSAPLGSPFAAVPAQFAAQVRRSPDAIAVASRSLRMSYLEVDQRADALAQQLLAAGVGAEDVVGICLESGPYLVVSMLAAWKAGAAFVPMDAQLPHERVRLLCREARIRVMLTAGGTTLPPLDAPMLMVDDLDERGPPRRQAEAMPDQLAYLMFTSGTTGAPRAVAVEHGSLANLVRWAVRDLQLGPHDRSGQLVSIGFDAIFLEIWPCLLAGGTVCTADRRDRQSPQLVQDWALANGVTIFFAPTPLGEALLALPWRAPCCLRLLLIGGETLRVYPDAALPFVVMNLYGPTENTVISTRTILPVVADAALPSIGRPIAGDFVLILDADLRPVPEGNIGEIFLAGQGVARGYYNDPALTRERFLSCDVGGMAGARMYRTGDFARLRPNGDIEFAGRRDRQVKIRGHRVELAEIEACLLGHAAVRDVAVLALATPLGSQRLAAYAVGAPGSDRKAVVAQLRAHAAARLPGYMRPAVFHCLDALPLTANGKTDIRALCAIDPDDAAGPYNSLAEQRLAGIFRDLLGVAGIEPESDFFALGGHSLLTARLSSGIGCAFGVTVTIEEIYRHASLQACARLIEARLLEPWLGAPMPACVVPLQTTGTSAPLFLAAPAGGSPVCYRALAAQLGAAQVVFGLQSPGLGNAMAPLTDVRAIAATFIEAVRRVQPCGPYRIGGWSFGATVGWEMAAQLIAQGEHVALLALIDGGVTTENATPRRAWIVDVGRVCLLALRFLDQIKWPRRYAEWRELAQWVGIGLPLSVRYTREAGWGERARILQRLTADAVRSLRVFGGNALAELRYAPVAVDCRTVLFRAGVGAPDALADGLRLLARGEIDVVAVPGNHMSLMMDQLHLAALAGELRAFLIETKKGSASF
jgi:amino acid adenylation domain-containing protein